MMSRWPLAGSGQRVKARIKVQPGDFRVHETLSFTPTGSGEHLFVEVEETLLSTVEVANHLADLHGLRPVDVGYAGMKDKHAVTTQWFSLPVEALCPRVGQLEGDGKLRVQSETRHARKLRRGDNQGNSFQILLREVAGSCWSAGLEQLRVAGAPNYFGAQRFGWDNFQQAAAWLPDRRRRRTSRFKQGLYLSVLRSFLFNEVLAARVAEGSWASVLPGDLLEEGMPTGPLWGRGRSPASLRAAEIEGAALAEHDSIRSGLEHAGLTQQRRPLVLKAGDLGWSEEAPGLLQLRFALPAGGFATSLLREVFDLDTGAPPAAGKVASSQADAAEVEG